MTLSDWLKRVRELDDSVQNARPISFERRKCIDQLGLFLYSNFDLILALGEVADKARLQFFLQVRMRDMRPALYTQLDHLAEMTEHKRATDALQGALSRLDAILAKEKK